MRLARFGPRSRLVAALAFSLWAVARAVAAEPSAIRSPVPATESLRHFAVPGGLQVELVAHEPAVIDPVAIRFDEEGRLWVVEMRDYPTASAKGNKARSRISILRDNDGDGFFEAARVFADDLPYATGIQPWKGGVFVTMAGRVAYMKDSDGDHRADVVDTWYTGFAQKNTQLRANHPRLAPDNHIYIANGLRGGEIVDARNPQASPVSISGMDFRFDPRTRQFEPVSGVGQFGLTFDDYGNRFVCSNRNPAIHIVLEDRQVKKNPLVAVPAVSTDVAKAGAESRVYPLTRAWTTSHLHAGQFTAACGVDVYRGDALPAEFRGNLFVCEPTGHLVHREAMKSHGVTFTSSSPDGNREFLASRDEWFSPVNLETGPDGALYIVDMYRAVIEHPHWMPAELRQRPDLTLGNDRGRIYRIVPQRFRRPAAPRLASAPSARLVGLLTHPNAWWRETAARLLLERHDKRVGPRLEKMALHHDNPLARIHALWLLGGLDVLRDDVIEQLLADSNPRVVEQAIAAAEPRLLHSRGLRDRVARLVADDDPRVRFQAQLAAMPLPAPPAFPADRWELDAMLIAAGARGGTVLAAMLHRSDLLEANVEDPTQFVADLARLAAASRNSAEQAIAVDALLNSRAFGRAGLSGFLAEALSNGFSLDDLRATLSQESRAKLDAMFAEANADAASRGQPEKARCEAIDLIAFATDADGPLLRLAIDDPNQAVSMRAIASLAKRSTIEPWRDLLDRFASQTPAIQRAILDAVFVSADRTSLLLDEIEAGRIKPAEIDAARAKSLLAHVDAQIKTRAQKLLAGALPADREQALADYQVVLTMEANPARGRGIFAKHCAICHQVDGVGVSFAPDISDSREKSAEQLLTDIIQPNRAIDSNYFSYTAVTDDGLVHTGVLAAETSNSVTLKQAEGKSLSLLRNDIHELRSDGVSFMPDGMEKTIPPQDMADLISFIKNWRYLKTERRSPATQ
jgi:putative membrane-bound dehydrogenase-like protein